MVGSMFFGSKDDAPGGNLDRITVQKFPDQYPAEKVLQAEPVAGDSRDVAVIRPLLKQTELGRQGAEHRSPEHIIQNLSLS